MAKTKKKKTAGGKSPAQKAADTMRRRRLDAAQAKTAEDAKTQKPAIEKPDVKITPYPRTGDNREFEDILDGAGREKESSAKAKPAKPAVAPGPAIGGEILAADDVAEWVAWPFLLWAQSTDLAGMALSSKEAKSVAEPLTSILNRHGASRVLPPDAIDALKASARLTPIMGDRFAAIKRARAQRGGGAGTPGKVVPGSAESNQTQGAQATKPREV